MGEIIRQVAIEWSTMLGKIAGLDRMGYPALHEKNPNAVVDLEQCRIFVATFCWLCSPFAYAGFWHLQFRNNYLESWKLDDGNVDSKSMTSKKKVSLDDGNVDICRKSLYLKMLEPWFQARIFPPTIHPLMSRAQFLHSKAASVAFEHRKSLIKLGWLANSIYMEQFIARKNHL